MTTAVLRPNSTITGADTLSGAASAHAAASDESDSSYFADDDVVALGFGTVSLPAGSVTKQLRHRWKADHNGSQSLVEVLCETKVGATVVASAVETVPVVPTVLASAYTPVTLVQSQVDALSLRWSFVQQDPEVSHRVFAAYIDLVYVTKPVTSVTAVTPDPYTASTFVPVSWVNTLDADGGGQTRYRIKVFDDVTYGGVGFDPATSSPFLATGTVVSSDTSASVGPLPNDDYRVYVQVAQTVNGGTHWSDWAFDAVIVTVADAEIDTVTMLADNDNGLIQVTVDRDTGTEAWDFVEVQRSIDAGTTWSYVRGAAYVDATDDADTFVVDDYEVANAQTAKYRARATRIVSDLPITSPWVESAGTTAWSSDDLWLKDPNDPSKNLIVKLWRTPTESTSVQRGVFNVIGSRFPIIVSDERESTRGTIHVQVQTIADVAALRSLLRSPVLLVHAQPTKDLGFEYISPGHAERARVPRPLIRHESWNVDFDEVDVPADPAAGV